MTDPLEVTVPCPSCSAAVGFPGRLCRSCGAVVPAAVREALERRLEAADEDFRDGRAATRSASMILLLLALVSLGGGLGKYALEVSSDLAGRQDQVGALGELAMALAVGAVFFGCFAWARRNPLPAVASGLGVWLLAQVASTIASPISALPIGVGGFVRAFLRLAILLFLVRGLVAAARGQRLLRRMTR
ncbi:MAG TPA: hypothetical protein VIH93_01840 [Thermoanaerobaculia bacterium]|jgi:hypothetical protein